VIPFIVVWVGAGLSFARNLFAYNSQANRWGVGFALYELYLHEPSRRFALDAMRFYFENGRWFILAAVAMLSFFSWRRRAWDAYELAAVTFSIFLVLTPGFGLQYTVIVAPLLLAVGLRVGTIHGLLCGLFLFIAYASAWTGTVPLQSFYDGPFSRAAAGAGAVVWVALLVISIRVMTGKRAAAAYTPPRDAG
jgi:hypothetical protein